MGSQQLDEMETWLRARAANLIFAADVMHLEKQFLPTKEGNVETNGSLPAQVSVSSDTVAEAIRAKRGAGRAKEVATRLGTTKDRVMKIVKANPKIFQIAKYGWIKLRPAG